MPSWPPTSWMTSRCSGCASVTRTWRSKGAVPVRRAIAGRAPAVVPMNDDRDGPGSEGQDNHHAPALHEAVGAIGEEELKRTPSALMWSGLAAGLSMGFSMVASGALQAYLPDMPFAHLLTALGYSTGFVIVIMARQQLFTENTL